MAVWCAVGAGSVVGASTSDGAAPSGLVVEAVPEAGPSTLTPQRFYVTKQARSGFAALFERSATFRSQCNRIADAGVIVMVEFRHPATLDPRVDALSTIAREGGRVMFVRVGLRPGEQWLVHLAHELEHVIEQIEGVDLEALARARRGDAWQAFTGVYETRRARQAGLQVKQEMRRRQPPAVLAIQTPEPAASVTP